MDVLDLIYHQFSFTANCLGRVATTSQFFQHLTPQSSALVAAAIHCALSEHATGLKVPVMFSQDEYRGKFCPSTVIDCITAEGIAHIKFTLHTVGLPHTPSPMVRLRYNRCSSIPVGAPQVPSALHNPRRHSSIPSALFSLDWCLDISFSSAYCLFCLAFSSRMGAPQSPAQLRLEAPQFQSRLYTSLTFRHCSHWMGCSAALALLNPHRCCLTRNCAHQFRSALFHHHHHSRCPPRTQQQALLLSWWRSSFSTRIHHIAFQSPL
jgi:hypothetical protein